MDSVPSIADFYKDRSIFITGGTGFLGKVLVEKLLRSCPNLDKIYLLVRPTSEDVDTRIQNLLKSPIFEPLKETRPVVLKKVVGLGGNILNPELGLSGEDEQLVIENVSVVFHVASSIRFDDTLTTATKTNVMSTVKIIQLCRKLKKLAAMVYVSTAYSNCDRKYVEEIVYPTQLEPDRLLSFVNWMKEEVLNLISSKIIGNKITTYHLTKATSEAIISKEGTSLPSVIVRPSLVVGSWKEPIVGYTETMYHVNGIIIGAGRGVMRVLHCDPETVAEIVPVDVAVNMMLSSAWFKATQETNTGTTILNCVSGIDNPLTYGQLKAYTLPVLRSKPFLYPVFYPNLSLVKNKYIAMFWTFFLHWVPAIFCDFLLQIAGQRPRLKRVMQRIQKTGDITEFFLNNNFTFTNANVRLLWHAMKEKDRHTFCFDMTNLSWEEYFRSYVLGCKQYVLKEDLSTIPRARVQMRWSRCLYYGIILLIFLPLFVFILFKIT